MAIGKLCLAAVLGALPAMAVAQPSVQLDVGVNVGVDTYDTTAPGDPVESVDVFYDQLSPYGVWVDEPDAGRVFIPDTASYVPYTTGHWQYTSVGFVWVSSEPHAWATSHYGRWAYSNNYGRWYWRPDTQWGPAWVEWRQTGTDFGWAPLAPDVVVRAGWQPPVESWHYCSAEHVLDPNVTRYYEPRERVVEIHREARPLEHYSTISNVRVVVGPPAATLRERHVTVRPVKVEARTVGRWTQTETHAQVAHAREHQAVFETQNQHRIETNARLHTAQVKVIETHPQIKAQVTARVQVGGGHPGEPNRVEPNRIAPNHAEPDRAAPNRGEPNRAAPNRGEPNRAGEPNRGEPNRGEPNRGEPNRGEPKGSPGPAHTVPEHRAPGDPAHAAPNRAVEPSHVAPRAPVEHAPARPAPERPAPEHVAPRTPVEHAPARPAPERPAPERPAPERPAPEHMAPRAPVEHAPERPAPERGAPKPPAAEPKASAEHAQPPQHNEPARRDERKEPDHH
jgi:uncharacterized protein DUF6600